MTSTDMSPEPTSRMRAGTVFFDRQHHCFESVPSLDIDAATGGIAAPLSVILQVTRRCNFDCGFCSETAQMPDPTLDQLDQMRRNLSGVQRVFLSGGEPLIRNDFSEIASMFSKDFITAVPTNATPGKRIAKQLRDSVAFVNVGLEGPRATTNRVRGDYDKIMRGVFAFLDAGIRLSFSAVVLRSTMTALPFTFQIADTLGAGKLKLILPIRKGNGLYLAEEEFISENEAQVLFSRLVELRQEHAWRTSLRMTTWTPQTEGYSLLVYPDGRTFAWPVYDAEDKVEYLGNLLTTHISDLWKGYRFKKNHLAKYLGRSIRTVK